MSDDKYIVELSRDELLLMMGTLEREVEYGRYIGLTKKLIALYDKLEKTWKRNHPK